MGVAGLAKFLCRRRGVPASFRRAGNSFAVCPSYKVPRQVMDGICLLPDAAACGTFASDPGF